MTSIVRGTTIKFTITFKDVNGSILTTGLVPVLTITYRDSTNMDVEDSISLTPQSTTFVGSWESSRSVACKVEWSANSGGVTPFVVVDGSFELVANQANIAASS